MPWKRMLLKSSAATWKGAKGSVRWVMGLPVYLVFDA
jgi:hypothetical protein